MGSDLGSILLKHKQPPVCPNNAIQNDQINVAQFVQQGNIMYETPEESEIPLPPKGQMLQNPINVPVQPAMQNLQPNPMVAQQVQNMSVQ